MPNNMLTCTLMSASLLLIAGSVSGQAQFGYGFQSPFGSLSIDGGVETETNAPDTEEFLPGSTNLISGMFGIPNPARFFNYYKPKPTPFQQCPVEQLNRNSLIRVEYPSTVAGSRQPPDTTCGLQFSGVKTYYKKCSPIIECPCFNIPSNNGCLDNYLEISDPVFNRRRFCGTEKPNGAYFARSSLLQLRSRGGGFTCFVTCGSTWNRPSGFICPAETGATASPTPSATVTPAPTVPTPGPVVTNSPATVIPTPLPGTGGIIPIEAPGPDQP